MQKTINNILFSQFISIIYYAAKTAVQKTRRDYNKNNYYVFLVNKSEKGGKNGIMPFNRHFGFMFMENIQQLKANSQKLYHTIAHELAHGAFTLYHTFSTKNKGITKGSSFNLMDYTTKQPDNLLRKYQWYVIHNPRLSLFGGDEEEVSEGDETQAEVNAYYIFDKESGKAIQQDVIVKYTDKYGNPLPNSFNVYLNNRRTTITTINIINGKDEAHYLSQVGMKRIINDYKNYGNSFPNNYYEVFGKYLFSECVNYFNLNGAKTEVAAIHLTIQYLPYFLDNTTGFDNGKGAPLFHIYENVARKNDDTGYDKLLHYSFSAKYEFILGNDLSTLLGYCKEFFKDEIPSWFTDDIGWDDNDIKANVAGQELGKKYKNQCINYESGGN